MILNSVVSGFRVDLVAFVRFATYSLLNKTDMSGVAVDIWGDGFARGNRETTRLAFRLLHTLPQNTSQQSSNAVFTFAAFYGKDSRYNLEQNIGWTVCGDQESGWLFQQTKKLVIDLGCEVTVSGDSPFLLHLILDINKEDSNAYPSWLPLYLGENNRILPTSVGPDGFRTTLEIPFRTDLPTKSLIYIKTTKYVCPDVTHMTTRNVENDLKKMADFI